jgi:hypothetical protein
VRSFVVRLAACVVCATLVAATAPCLDRVGPSSPAAAMAQVHDSHGSDPAPCHGARAAIPELGGLCPCGCTEIAQTTSSTGPRLLGALPGVLRAERRVGIPTRFAILASASPAAIDHVPIRVLPVSI